MKRTAMINIKTILRLRHDLKLSRDDIVAASGVSAGHGIECSGTGGGGGPGLLAAAG